MDDALIRGAFKSSSVLLEKVHVSVSLSLFLDLNCFGAAPSCLRSSQERERYFKVTVTVPSPSLCLRISGDIGTLFCPRVRNTSIR